MNKRNSQIPSLARLSEFISETQRDLDNGYVPVTRTLESSYHVIDFSIGGRPTAEAGMGSSGSGSFSDYSDKSNQSQSGEGGSSGDDICGQAFSTGIEDIEEYDLFSQNGVIPAIGAALSLAHQGRIIALDANGVSVGALPTKYNYLASCLKDGFNYRGIVTASTTSPNPRLTADFAPI